MGETGKDHGICFSQHAGDRFQHRYCDHEKTLYFFLMFFATQAQNLGLKSA